MAGGQSSASILKLEQSLYDTPYPTEDTWDQAKYATLPNELEKSTNPASKHKQDSEYQELSFEKQAGAYDSVISTARLETDRPDILSNQLYQPAPAHNDYEEIPYGVGGQRKQAATRSTKWRWVLLATAILVIAGTVAGIGASGAFSLSSSHSSSASTSCELLG